MKQQPLKRPHRRWLFWFLAVSILFIIGYVALTTTTSTGPTTSTTTSSDASAAAAPGKVEVKSSSVRADTLGKALVGEVSNKTGQTVTNVWVDTTLYDKQGAVVDTHGSYAVPYGQTLSTGETAPFEINLSDNPFETYQLRVTWN